MASSARGGGQGPRRFLCTPASCAENLGEAGTVSLKLPWGLHFSSFPRGVPPTCRCSCPFPALAQSTLTPPQPASGPV